MKLNVTQRSNLVHVILKTHLTLNAEQLAKLMTESNYMFVGSDARALDGYLMLYIVAQENLN